MTLVTLRRRIWWCWDVEIGDVGTLRFGADVGLTGIVEAGALESKLIVPMFFSCVFLDSTDAIQIMVLFAGCTLEQLTSGISNGGLVLVMVVSQLNIIQ